MQEHPIGSLSHVSSPPLVHTPGRLVLVQRLVHNQFKQNVININYWKSKKLRDILPFSAMTNFYIDL